MGGILEQVRRAIQIQCLPADIPKGIDVDVSPLKIGDSIHVQDIQAEKVKIISETNFTIATVVPPVVEEKVAEAVAPEIAEGAEVKEEEGKGKEETQAFAISRSFSDPFAVRRNRPSLPFLPRGGSFGAFIFSVSILSLQAIYVSSVFPNYFLTDWLPSRSILRTADPTQNSLLPI